ncbi:MAG: PhnD/SsuA/transferrin family substrate-binding protein [Chloroflexi bacterium]|nr:PhnD/SsuA/transferrin family substrate-binding protein [Chloroflexota bacterium]
MRLTRRRVVCGAAVGMSALLAACGPPGGAPGSGRREPEKDKVVLGTPATMDIAKAYNQVKPLVTFLSQRGGIQFEPYVPSDVGYSLNRLGEGRIDVTWLSALFYVKSRAAGHSDVLFKMLRKDVSGRLTDRERGLVLVRPDGAKDVAALKGKVVASTNPDDVPGFLFPAWAVKKAGVDPLKELRLDYQTTSAGAVLRLLVPNKQGKFETDAAFAGAHGLIAPNVLKAEPNPAGKTRVLTAMDEAPLDVVVVRRGLHPSAVEKIRTAFNALSGPDAVYTDQDTKKPLVSIYGFDGIAEAKDSEYARVREAAQAVGIPLTVSKSLK